MNAGPLGVPLHRTSKNEKIEIKNPVGKLAAEKTAAAEERVREQ